MLACTSSLARRQDQGDSDSLTCTWCAHVEEKNNQDAGTSSAGARCVKGCMSMYDSSSILDQAKSIQMSFWEASHSLASWAPMALTTKTKTQVETVATSCCASWALACCTTTPSWTGENNKKSHGGWFIPTEFQEDDHCGKNHHKQTCCVASIWILILI